MSLPSGLLHFSIDPTYDISARTQGTGFERYYPGKLLMLLLLALTPISM